MKLASNLILLALAFVPAACETVSTSVSSLAQSINIGSLLASITDGQSATEAKPALDGAVAQLKAALMTAKSEATAGAEAEATDGAGMVQTVLAKFGIGPETAGTINSLLENPEVKTVLGGTLEQLMGMITG